MTGAIMGYPQTSIGVVDNTDGGFLYDSRFGNFYGISVNGATSGIRKWDAYPQGLERRARNIADLSVAGIYLYQTTTYRSQELVAAAGTANTSPLYGFSLADMSFTGQFGVVSGSLANSSSFRILATGELCAFLNKFGSDIVVSRTLIDGTTTGGQEINCITWGQKSNQKSNIAENHAVIGSVPDGSGRVAYAFGFPLGTGAMRLYSIGNTLNGVGITGTIGTLTVAQIDATWTNVTAVFGITVDQTDNHVILGFNTTDAVTNRGRLVKINSTTGAVIWSIPVAGNPGGVQYDVNDMTRNVIKNGTLYLIGSATNTLFTINTITGAFSSQTFDSGALSVLHPHQMSEDVTGSIMWYGGWSEGVTHPTYIGNFCGTLGNHTGGNMGWRFWLNGTPNPAPVYALPAASRKRAWSFVLDGHTFYVLDMGQQGTFLYDSTTSQWCQFITNGYVQWNFANGCMWGQRIVAGDLISTDTWEMQPGAFFDNNATEIVHVVTGGLITRSRTYHSADSFSLACSVGQLQDQTGIATVLLSFSDDQGQTWTNMDTKTLTQGDFGGEISWLALGSFAAPGRIFKITDTGGFLRIDGADAGVDGFDESTAETGS